MSANLTLKNSCDGCGSSEVELYGSTCGHVTLCLNCGKSMAEKASNCSECGASITRLIREYNVRVNPSSGTDYVVGQFDMNIGLPIFEKNDDRWSLRTGLQGCRVTEEALQTKYKLRPWVLEHEAGQFQYRGCFTSLNGGLSNPLYYLLFLQEQEFVAIPVDHWRFFSKVVRGEEVSLDEAEKRKKNRKLMVEARYKRAKAFRESRKKFAIVPNWREEEDEKEDEDEECMRGIKRKQLVDDGEYRFCFGDYIERGGDWDYEDIFGSDGEEITDSDEDGGERADPVAEYLVTKIPSYHEDYEFGSDEEYYEGLSESGKYMKKLLDRLNNFRADDDGDDDMFESDEEYYEGPSESGKDKLLNRSNNLRAGADDETCEELSKFMKEKTKLDDDNDGFTLDEKYLKLLKEVLKKEGLTDISKHPFSAEKSKTPARLKKVKTKYLRPVVKSVKDEIVTLRDEFQAVSITEKTTASPNGFD